MLALLWQKGEYVIAVLASSISAVYVLKMPSFVDYLSSAPFFSLLRKSILRTGPRLDYAPCLGSPFDGGCSNLRPAAEIGRIADDTSNGTVGILLPTTQHRNLILGCCCRFGTTASTEKGKGLFLFDRLRSDFRFFLLGGTE